MRNKTIYPVLAAVGIAVAGGAAWWYQNQPSTPKEAVSAPSPARAGGPPRAAGVEVVKVSQLSLQDDAQSVGSLRSRQSVMLRPEVSGRVQQLGFSDGARVRKGQMLVQLDDTLQRAEILQTQAQVSIATANHKRNQELVAQNFLAQRVLDESAANLQVAQAQLALSQARLSRMRITAPFDGTLGLRNVNLGDYVKDGADLVNLEDLSSMVVDFRLPERFQRKVKVGQNVDLALDAFPGRIFTARIEALDPLLDTNGRSVGVRAILPNNEGKDARPGADAPKPSLVPGVGTGPLRPGMFARVTAVFGVNASALVVPEEAIVPQGGKQFVVRVVPAPATKGGAAGSPAVQEWVSQRQEVSLGVRRAGKVEITKGLDLGETVVVAGQQRLQKDGSPVRIIDTGAARP